MYYALKEKKIFMYWCCISIALLQLLGLRGVVSVLMSCNGVILSICNSPLLISSPGKCVF